MLLCPFFRNLHLRENLATDCFTSTVSTVINSVQIFLPVYAIVTNKRLQPLTNTWYNSLVLYFPLLNISRRLIKHRSFLHDLRSWGERSQLCRRGCRSTTSSSSNTLLPHIHGKACIEVYAMEVSHTHTHNNTNENLTKHNIKKKLC